MPIVHMTVPSGKRIELEVKTGTPIMRAAVDAGTEGIIGECGGAAMCGTCHVLVDEAWLDRLPLMSQNEDDMLECTAVPRQANSRLSCQLRMTEELEGLELTLPERQR
ncbi:(2Fe-2S)-binding protein [Ramlibacter henchirensis]|jgi:ferredoxin, 2Fe-2S|uniref:(2Fe-2S)-binding protein n=1 Tax=Ramlibacter henchirensis TaxID=204072 RepID=A0A4Z0BVU6_9BURK|nr:2Fe-2S iron-sulfur cluster-binding protein [Ramlibacter henchirensis]TFZ02832.1 (2Fe-2S)-binding protein [Ramlibacter henchirensis]